MILPAKQSNIASKIKNLSEFFEDIISILIPRIKSQLKPELQALFTNYIKYYINPTGKFVIGGPHGNSGLTGHKIIVDTYGGKGAHGGGTFSGKDPSNLDRSAAYATRHIAKNLVAAGVCDEVSVQVSYAIGSKNPIGIYINTDHSAKVELSDKEISQKIESIFDMTPYGLETRLKLRSPIYAETAAYGHMGRKHEVVTKKFENASGTIKSVEVELFTWEKLDYVDKLKIAFGL